MASNQVAPRQPPARGGRGCLVVALVAIPLLLVALPFAIVLGTRLAAREGPTTGPSALTAPASASPPPKVTGHVTLSGSVTQALDGEMSFFSNDGGTSCRSQARGFKGFFFHYTSSDGSNTLTVSVYTPRGGVGPGTYQTSDLSVSYVPGPGQEWASQAGQTTGTLVLKPDGSGTLSVTGLHSQRPGTGTARRPLVFSMSFSCG
jgi:hypothetical protein